ncbi:MAG: hypothetical protein CBB65_11645 [Hyphomonadaceae bacterium TMED5]|nr:hypothetical protein [Ponticaulis sp.]OUX98417.1 MAG: hypothetical protein CBB65_11645 [Hyphomonadaceae bacterium TMED5]|tara:strand:- start:44406 stop:44930 length:525 start_codon:yes stop_codon:yes gene_type:complete
MLLKALGKGSIASALYVLMTAITILGWIVFGICVAILVITMAIDLSGGQLQWDLLEGNLSVDTPTYLIGFGSLFVIFIGFILMAGQLKTILKTLIDGDPFVPENARRLTRLALIVGGMEIFRHILGFAAHAFQVNTSMNFSINLAAWVAVITLMVLSQVFAEGTRLREEEKMTI